MKRQSYMENLVLNDLVWGISLNNHSRFIIAFIHTEHSQVTQCFSDLRLPHECKVIFVLVMLLYLQVQFVYLICQVYPLLSFLKYQQCSWTLIKTCYVLKLSWNWTLLVLQYSKYDHIGAYMEKLLLKELLLKFSTQQYFKI